MAMKKQIRQILIILLLGMILTACSSNPTVNQNNGPILLQEVTIAPTNAQATRALTNTPSPTPPVLEAPQQVQLTVASGFVLVTPTLPPSKTPTMTPTITATSSVTPIIIPSLIPTTPAPNSFPTSAIVPLTAIPTAYPPNFPPVNPPVIGNTPFPTVPTSCQFIWFFPDPKPPFCPLSPQTISPAAYQTFEYGFMIWVGSQDAIYVMFNDVLNPRWQVFRDNYEESMPAEDPMYNTPPNPATYQPRRGFGLLWRNNEAIRSRLGWATTPSEAPYNAQTQTGADSTLFISDPQNGVFMLLAQGVEWDRYTGVGIIIP